MIISVSLVKSIHFHESQHLAKPAVMIVLHIINPLISNITLQILLSCCHTLLTAETGRIS